MKLQILSADAAKRMDEGDCLIPINWLNRKDAETLFRVLSYKPDFYIGSYCCHNHFHNYNRNRASEPGFFECFDFLPQPFYGHTTGSFHRKCAHSPSWFAIFEYEPSNRVYRLVVMPALSPQLSYPDVPDGWAECVKEDFAYHAYLDLNGDLIVRPTKHIYNGEKMLNTPIRLLWSDVGYRTEMSTIAWRRFRECGCITITHEKGDLDYAPPSDINDGGESARPEKLKESEATTQCIEQKDEPIETAKHIEQKGDDVMKNMFDFTMHQIDDGSVASTILGVAVKVGDSWRIYDKGKKTITDLGDLQLGNFPIWVIPAFKLTTGDIIIENDKYYCVTGENNRIQTVDIATGRTHSVVPVKNILGFSVYQKVVAITDVLDIDANSGDLMDNKSMLMLAMMSGAQFSDNGIQSLLPLMLLGGKGDLGDNKLLLLAMMSGMNNSGDQQNGLMQLLFMKNLLSDEPKSTDK